MSWCFCQACTSLLSSCFGNDKPSTVPPSATSGRKRSVALLILSIGLSLAFQYGVAKQLVESEINNMVKDAWLDGCDGLSEDLQKVCAGNNGNFRVSCATFIFFCLAGVAALLKPTANREAWPAKYTIYLFMVLISVFIPNRPLFASIFLNIARSTFQSLNVDTLSQVVLTFSIPSTISRRCCFHRCTAADYTGLGLQLERQLGHEIERSGGSRGWQWEKVASGYSLCVRYELCVFIRYVGIHAHGFYRLFE